MAVIHAEFFSHSLMRTVSFCALIPAEDPAPNAQGNIAKAPVISGFRTLYLLHGLYGSHTDWLTMSCIRRYAAEKRLAVIMPSAENRFYIDGKLPGEKYGIFIGEELVEQTRNLFYLSVKRKDTFIAGLSMGGAGAIRTACLYPQIFCAAAGMSSAFLTKECISESHPVFTPEWVQSTFGSIERMESFYKEAAQKLMQTTKKSDFPSLYLSCGTEDFLLNANRKFHQFLTAQKLEHRYEEKTGDHSWEFWNAEIKTVIDSLF